MERLPLMKPSLSIQSGRDSMTPMPQMVKCPCCQKIGYTDERHELDGKWPCAKCYREIMNGEQLVWAWEVKED